mmetsp:Transcript_8868/g.23168  ORF Transcript_8868/g.23168 Transcript_8868/m.23168 type:complete len:226 (+) Transcript_8868:48-725(+)
MMGTPLSVPHGTNYSKISPRPRARLLESRYIDRLASQTKLRRDFSPATFPAAARGSEHNNSQHSREMQVWSHATRLSQKTDRLWLSSRGQSRLGTGGSGRGLCAPIAKSHARTAQVPCLWKRQDTPFLWLHANHATCPTAHEHGGSMGHARCERLRRLCVHEVCQNARGGAAWGTEGTAGSIGRSTASSVSVRAAPQEAVREELTPSKTRTTCRPSRRKRQARST